MIPVGYNAPWKVVAYRNGFVIEGQPVKDTLKVVAMAAFGGVGEYPAADTRRHAHVIAAAPELYAVAKAIMEAGTSVGYETALANAIEKAEGR